ncbi:MAG TPA: ABC transporter substrate-binding protein [Xanthobacteraceae bacterium]|nr:ABC transporter substrate-binding protein [Xanthobacteraceae bacterium]
MNKIKLTIATTDYDHFRDFRTGAVQAEGIEHIWLTLGHHEIFSRFTFKREWDVTELSFAKFTAQVTRANPDIIGLLASRLFRFGSFYVNRKSGIKTAADLKGKSIGSPEWARTAAFYMRGWLHHEAGVKLQDVHWYQAGANEAGRIEKVELSLPPGVKLARVADKSLSEMIASGEIDCALIARPPNSFLAGHPDVVRLFPNFHELEEQHFAKSEVFPIMHVIALKREILDAHPWAARNLYNAFNDRSGAASNACSIRQCRAIRCRGCRPMRARCATSSAATPIRSGSRRTGRRWSCSCNIRSNRVSPTGTPSRRRFSRRASWRR